MAGRPMTNHRFIEEMPKAELHLHIEGTLEPEMVIGLARRNAIMLRYDTVEDVRAAYRFSCLQDFLNVYYAGMSVLTERADFFDLAWAYLERAHSQNVTHVEIFFDPQAHTERGVAFDTVLSGLADVLDKARRELKISARLIMCFLRHLPEEAAFETLRDARRCKDHIFGVGLDSSELGNPPSKFERVFSQARDEGFVPVAHAGEEGPAAYVREALDLLHVKRLDHGNRIIEDSELLARVAEEQIPLTLCPLSNLSLNVIGAIGDHPLPKLLEAGVLVTINSDDPAYFGGYVNENYFAVSDAFGLDQSQIEQLGRNSFMGSFLTDAEKRRTLEEFDAFSRKFRH